MRGRALFVIAAVLALAAIEERLGDELFTRQTAFSALVDCRALRHRVFITVQEFVT